MFTARYQPSGTVRLMWDVGGASQVHYQIAGDPGFANIVSEAVVGVTANYVDVVLPSAVGTYYARVRLADEAGSWSGWSNTVTFRVDRLVLNVSAGRSASDISSNVNLTIDLTYTDGSAVPVALVHYNVTVEQLGVDRVADSWWCVDVYSADRYAGVPWDYEPPGPGYTYLGSVCPMSTHSYFTSWFRSYYDFTYRTPFMSAYSLMNIYDFNEIPGLQPAPYWVLGFNRTDFFALIYSAWVYLPQSGAYTIEFEFLARGKIYVDDVPLTGWIGGGGTVSVDLSAGWHKFTIKYGEDWQDRNFM
jgi:hypothetical protein